jgi:ribosomal protein S18 acetylase RimI-like enzyme
MTSWAIRQARESEDSLLAVHFQRMWADIGLTKDQVLEDARERTRSFIEEARKRLEYRAFIAETAGGEVVGSAGCQIFAGLYPNVLAPQYRRYGYVWGVFVEPAYRKTGVATALTDAANRYLQAIGCTHVLLHASPQGRHVYERLGFEPTNEMRLTFPSPAEAPSSSE